MGLENCMIIEHRKRAAAVVALAGVILFVPRIVLAQKPGPSQPEFRSFTPAGQPELVDPFTGDFQYNITLFEVPGPNGSYPINLAYRSGISMDQEASWVGLGWTLNPGSIQRQLRGLPDAFLYDPAVGVGDECDPTTQDCITDVRDIEPFQTYGFGIEGNVELFGAHFSKATGLVVGLTGYYNNYRGLGVTQTVGLKGQHIASGIGAAVGLALDSQEGLKATASLSLKDSLATSAGLDSVRGLSSLSIGVQSKNLNVSADALGFLGYARPATFPPVGSAMSGWNVALSAKPGSRTVGCAPKRQAARILHTPVSRSQRDALKSLRVSASRQGGR